MVEPWLSQALVSCGCAQDLRDPPHLSSFPSRRASLGSVDFWGASHYIGPKLTGTQKWKTSMRARDMDLHAGCST